MVNRSTLDGLISILAENKIVCGIGGSYLLQMYNLYSEPKDIDFWVAPDDMDRLRKIFCDYEEIEEKLQLPKKYHFKMRYMDIDVDFVACFIVKPNQNEYVYNIRPDSINMIDVGNGKKMPCTSLEDWYIVYKLLKRDKKAELIRNFICKQKVPIPNKKLEMSLENKNNRLPYRLMKDIKDFIWENSQFNIYDFCELECKEEEYDNKTLNSTIEVNSK